MINHIDFRSALKAALVGPSIKNVEWTKNGHDFNIKKVSIKETDEGLVIDGKDGKHISHRRSYLPDDQVYFYCIVDKDGKIKELDVNIKSTAEVLKEWFKTAGEIISVIVVIATAAKADSAKADSSSAIDFDTVEPTPSSIVMLDGDWESDVNFMIANIITYATLMHYPELAKKEEQKDFSKKTITVNPILVEMFYKKKLQIAEG